MTSGPDAAPAPPPAAALTRRAATVRLGVIGAVMVAAFAAFWLFDLVDSGDVRALVDDAGPLAPVAYVLISAVLGAALVPGPVLAGTSGLLFGAWVGTLVTIAATVLSAVLSLLLARRTAGGAVHAVSGERMRALAELAERHGTLAVIFQRLLPAVPDAPLSYVFGAIGLRVWQIALGTAVGASPRAFSYTSFGASLDDPSSPAAYVGLAVLVVTGLVGAELARRMVMRSRRARRARPPLPRSGGAHGRTPPSSG
ncbi:MAG TPA: VTT domain-containing protein [Solirubrobacteraceae bacterium]|nr:VTT domain-containing protein [Solirubrobacteraceae bacterium]